MSDLRLRRLESDHEAVRRLAHLHPRIEVEGVTGNPPERYRLRLHVKSLRRNGESVEIAEVHRLEITIPRDYPRVPPHFRMLTPVFHPNIAPQAVCIGDHWSAAETLDLMIQRVGEMLAFQSYNIKSPLNGRAARWVDEHLDRLPVDDREFFIDLDAEPDSDADGDAVADECSNCGTRSSPLVACDAGHRLCGDCVARCECGRLLCLSCGISDCETCRAPACDNCGQTGDVVRRCSAGHVLCAACTVECDGCGASLCLTCGEYPCAACARGNED